MLRAPGKYDTDAGDGTDAGDNILMSRWPGRLQQLRCTLDEMSRALI